MSGFQGCDQYPISLVLWVRYKNGFQMPTWFCILYTIIKINHQKVQTTIFLFHFIGCFSKFDSDIIDDISDSMSPIQVDFRMPTWFCQLYMHIKQNSTISDFNVCFSRLWSDSFYDISGSMWPIRLLSFVNCKLNRFFLFIRLLPASFSLMV